MTWTWGVCCGKTSSGVEWWIQSLAAKNEASSAPPANDLWNSLIWRRRGCRFDNTRLCLWPGHNLCGVESLKLLIHDGNLINLCHLLDFWSLIMVPPAHRTTFQHNHMALRAITALCLMPFQIFTACSLWAWSQETSPRSKSPPPPSTTPTGPTNALASTTRRTAGHRPTTPWGSGYRSAVRHLVGHYVSFLDLCSHWAPPRICSGYCSLICTESLHRRNVQHALFRRNRLPSSTVDFSYLHLEIWHCAVTESGIRAARCLTSWNVFNNFLSSGQTGCWVVFGSVNEYETSDPTASVSVSVSIWTLLVRTVPFFCLPSKCFSATLLKFFTEWGHF